MFRSRARSSPAVEPRERPLRLHAILALLSGALLGFSFPKFGHPVFAWAALAPLILAVVLASLAPRLRARRLFWLGWLTGLVVFAIAVYWVVPVMDGYGGLPWVVAALVGALLVAYLAVYPGLFALLLGLAVRRLGFGAIWLAPLIWVAGEWVRSWFASGFAWAFVGTTQASVLPIVQIASVVGVYGLSAFVLLISTTAAALALDRSRRTRVTAAGVAVLFVGVAVWGMQRAGRDTLTTAGAPLRVGLVQGNIDQAHKWDPAYRDRIMAQYIRLSREALMAGAEIVLWPEAATPFFFNLEAPYADVIRRLAAESRTPFLIGSDELIRGATRAEDRYFNSAMFIDATGTPRGSYRKMRLVPFGEFVPFKRLLFFVGPLIEAVSDFSAGTEPVVFDAGGRRVSVAICYESIYPWIADAFVERGTQLLATITNDAWFGTSSAAYQHWEQGAIRAVEQGRYIVRAANTGISGAVDPYGRTITRTALFEAGSVVVDIRLLDGRTIYSRIGDIIVWLAIAATAWVVVVIFRGRLRRRPATQP